MRRKTTALSFAALHVEGNLIAPAMLEAIDRREAGEQADADYGVPKGLTIRDEIARYFRIGQALYAEFAKAESPSSLATTRFVEVLLSQVFGFSGIARIGSRTEDGRLFALTLEALDGRVPVLVVPSSDGLDQASDHLPTEGRRRSAATALQDWLNHAEPALWGLATNGQRLRLMRDNQSLTRPAYLEADLPQIFETDDFASFSALWLTVHSSRFGRAPTPTTDCALERWREQGAKEGVAARDRLRDGVEAALAVLGTGFLDANPELRDKLATGQLPLQDYFTELLRLVYRLIFLMAAEDRDLLHPPTAARSAKRLYAEGYSLTALRERAVRRTAWDTHADRWEGMKIVFSALDRGEKLLGLPSLGGLFSGGAVPDLEQTSLSNRALMEAIYRLAWIRDGAALHPVNWRGMETEELGSVYESLLQLTPRLSEDGRAFTFAEAQAETRGNQRKTTGSYYTPDSLVQALLDSALDPVLDRVEAEADDPAEALAKVSVIDPACGSGHFLLAAARRIATRVARIRAGGVASAGDYRHALRDVVRQAIHGVDRNPMAVELTKVALWIETVEPGKPLGFLDANIRCGDALLGIFDLDALKEGIPDAAYKPLTGDDKETAKHFAKRNKTEREGQGALDFAGGGGGLPAPPPLASGAAALRALPEDTADDIATKEKRYAAWRKDPRRWAWRQACDLYIAGFLTPKTGGVPDNRNTVTIATTAHLWKQAAGGQLYGPLIARAQDLADEARAFHWPLQFPDVFDKGGFDVVLGNPPWERIKLQEQEFFAARAPEIAEALNAAARGRMIAALAKAEEGTRERKLHGEFEFAKRTAEAVSAFARVPAEERGRFPLTGRGDVNTYALFAELFSRLASKRGRAGVIVPTGIATDATTAPFFGALIDGKRLARLVDFENRNAIFPAVHRSYKFCLLTIASEVEEAGFAFFLTDLAQLAEPERNFTLSPEQIATINPNTKTAPVFRSQADAELTAKIYARVPVLIDEGKGERGNPWNASFYTRIWHMAEDSEWFRTDADLRKLDLTFDGKDWIGGAGDGSEQLSEGFSRKGDGIHLDWQAGGVGSADHLVPLYEAKMIHQFDHRWATYEPASTSSRYASIDEKHSPSFEPLPRYWVPKHEVNARLAGKGWGYDWLMGWRKITRSTDERTLIASVFPRTAAGDSLPLILPSVSPLSAACLLANLSAIVTDYAERQKLGGTNLTFQFLFQIPVLPPSYFDRACMEFVVPHVLELTYTSRALESFARDLGYGGPPFVWDEERRAHLRAELDAFFARAYGLTRDELRYILDPADVKGPDYPSETFRVLKNNEIRKFGEFRTQRLVLAAWDRFEAKGWPGEEGASSKVEGIQ